MATVRFPHPFPAGNTIVIRKGGMVNVAELAALLGVEEKRVRAALKDKSGANEVCVMDHFERVCRGATKWTEDESANAMALMEMACHATRGYGPDDGVIDIEVTEGHSDDPLDRIERAVERYCGDSVKRLRPEPVGRATMMDAYGEQMAHAMSAAANALRPAMMAVAEAELAADMERRRAAHRQTLDMQMTERLRAGQQALDAEFAKRDAKPTEPTPAMLASMLVQPTTQAVAPSPAIMDDPMKAIFKAALEKK